VHAAQIPLVRHAGWVVVAPPAHPGSSAVSLLAPGPAATIRGGWAC